MSRYSRRRRIIKDDTFWSALLTALNIRCLLAAIIATAAPRP